MPRAVLSWEGRGHPDRPLCMVRMMHQMIYYMGARLKYTIYYLGARMH